MAADVPEGTLLTVYENPAQSPTGEAFVREDYVKASPARDTAVARPPVRPSLPLAVGAADRASDLRVFTTMATWCTAGKGEMPQFRRLRRRSGRETWGCSECRSIPAKGRRRSKPGAPPTGPPTGC